MQVKQATNYMREAVALLVLGGLIWCAPMSARGEETTGAQTPVRMMTATIRVGGM